MAKRKRTRSSAVTRSAGGGADRAIARRRRARRGGEQEVPVGETPPRVVVGRGQEQLMPLIPSRPNYRKMRKHDDHAHIHVSDLLYKCGRRLALAHVYDIAIAEDPIFDSLSLTFRQGEAIHDHVRDVIAGKHPEKVWGKWTCPCEETSYEGVYAGALEHDECPSCGKKPLKHNEIPILNEEFNVIGSPDLELFWSNAFYITELKSMAARYWDELERPVPEHVIQVLMYWDLKRSAGYNLHDHVSILYVNKEYRPRNPYKEFTIYVPENLDRLASYYTEALAIKGAIEGGDLPERKVCSSPQSREAKKCEVCTLCFEVE